MESVYFATISAYTFIILSIFSPLASIQSRSYLPIEINCLSSFPSRVSHCQQKTLYLYYKLDSSPVLSQLLYEEVSGISLVIVALTLLISKSNTLSLIIFCIFINQCLCVKPSKSTSIRNIHSRFSIISICKIYITCSSIYFKYHTSCTYTIQYR